MKNVIIYSTPTCHYCQMAKEFFKENNIVYTEHNVAVDRVAGQESIKKSGQMGVPVIDVDGEIIIGFDEDKLRELLGVK
ncbi:MAG: glutaredoxin family protein [Patescibacteria group bacterium]